MSTNLKISISSEPITRLIKRIDTKCANLRDVDEFEERLCAVGSVVANLGFARAYYDGPKDVAISVDKTPDGHSVNAVGEHVAFIEFGSGASFGGTYPKDVVTIPFSTSAGFWSEGPFGKGHWNDPNGWWFYYPDDVRANSKGYVHSWGNPPARAMYDAVKAMRADVERIAREVFNR